MRAPPNDKINFVISKCLVLAKPQQSRNKLIMKTIENQNNT